MKTRAEAISYGLSFPNTYQKAPFHKNTESDPFKAVAVDFYPAGVQLTRAL